MSTPKGMPRGYFKYVLAVDSETTGLCFKNYDHNENPVYNSTTGERHQALSWGFLVVDTEDFSIVDELYIEVQWNEESLLQRHEDPSFGKKAEEVHGLTLSYLEEHGIPEEEAVMLIGELILKWFGPENAIKLLGHNVHLFDLAFLRDLFKRYGIALKFGNRHYDTNSGAFMTFGTWNSDDLFEQIGFEARGDHNALDDIKMTVEAARIMKMIFQKALDEQ
jgi:DNA polymerase III epsilon subunit-like protein